MNRLWFKELVHTIEQSVLFFVEELNPDIKKRKDILDKISKVKELVPKDLRIANSFFTHLTVLGDLKDGCGMNPHFDEKDIITAIFHVGSTTEGGSTLYYNGLSVDQVGVTMKEIKFKHGRLQIGQYKDIIHSVQSWKGQRGCLIFNVKETVLNHFIQESMTYYKQYQIQGYPSGPFLAT